MRGSVISKSVRQYIDSQVVPTAHHLLVTAYLQLVTSTQYLYQPVLPLTALYVALNLIDLYPFVLSLIHISLPLEESF